MTGKGWMLALSLGVAAIGGTALAQAPQRERNVIVYGDDPCPESQGDEIVVCGRRPEEERYRIPELLRRGDRRAEQSWGTRAAELEDAQRDTRPDGCSVVGSFGQSGCTQDMIRRWRAERRERRARAREGR
jgi:hypothetical protein